MYISGAKFEEHCFNTIKDILYSILDVIAETRKKYSKKKNAIPFYLLNTQQLLFMS